MGDSNGSLLTVGFFSLLFLNSQSYSFIHSCIERLSLVGAKCFKKRELVFVCSRELPAGRLFSVLAYS